MFWSLEILTSTIRTGLPILVELIDLVNFVIILSQMTLLRWLTFLCRSQTVILIVLLFWIYLFFLTLVFVHKRMPHFIAIAYDFSCADWGGLRDHLRDVLWGDIFKLGASAAASEFCQ